MNGTATEGIQPVADFLPQKPQSDAVASSDLTPVAKAQTAIPGFPSEPKIDAPTESSGPSGSTDVNAENFKQNAQVSATSDVAVNPSSTNGVSAVNGTGETNGTSKPVSNSESHPEADSKSSPQPPVPPSESLPTSDSAPLSQATEQTSDIPTQPTSDLREAPQPISQDSETALQIKNDKHQQDLARDPELAEALSAGGDAPIERSLEAPIMTEATPSQADAGTSDKMDTAADAAPVVSTSTVVPAAVPPPSEQPAAPAPTPVAPTPSEPAPVDQVMTEAPPAPAVPTKVVREREDDTIEAEPASKRVKTESASLEPEFKVPPVPHPSGEGDRNDQMTQARIKQLNRAIQLAKKVQCSRFFKLPVDPIAMNIPNYPEVIKHPMDLSTIEKKLKATPCGYSTVSAFKSDVELMINNAVIFNGPDHLVSKEGKDLKTRLLNDIKNLPPVEFEEPSRAEKKAQKVKSEPSRSIPARRQSITTPGTATVVPTVTAKSPPTATANQTFALTPEGVPLIRRDSNANDGRPKRAIHPPKRRDDITGGRPKKKKFEWQIKFCREVLAELKKPKHYNYAQYFYFPVDPVALNIPAYHSIIKKPMDLQTVENKLNANEYEKAKDFEEDVRLIFKNCFKFNIKGDHVFSSGEQLLKVFDDKWATKDDWLDDHEPQSGPVSPASESEEEEEDEGEESDSDAERNAQLQALQKQIEAMSKQMGELANAKKKKKSTPPVAAKKAKKSGSKKEAKSSAAFPSVPSKKEKSKSKPKTEKERFVTYNEKQYISAGISSLPDNRMSEALRIIQSNVPALKNTHETEIELDIDELPNHVLLKLLSFVKRFVPEAPPEPEPEKPYVAPSVAAAPSKPKKNKPMSKHEQEAQIEELRGRLGRYGGDQISPEPVQSIEQADSSGDDSDSEESEEE